MTEFLDADNRKWSLHLTVAALLRWRCESDLPDPMDLEASFEMLFTDPIKSAQACAAILAPGLAKAQLTPNGLLLAMEGTHAALAQVALREEYQRFFVESRQAALAAALVGMWVDKIQADCMRPKTSGTPCSGPQDVPESTPDLATVSAKSP